MTIHLGEQRVRAIHESGTSRGGPCARGVVLRRRGSGPCTRGVAFGRRGSRTNTVRHHGSRRCWCGSRRLKGSLGERGLATEYNVQRALARHWRQADPFHGSNPFTGTLHAECRPHRVSISPLKPCPHLLIRERALFAAVIVNVRPSHSILRVDRKKFARHVLALGLGLGRQRQIWIWQWCRTSQHLLAPGLGLGRQPSVRTFARAQGAGRPIGIWIWKWCRASQVLSIQYCPGFCRRWADFPRAFWTKPFNLGHRLCVCVCSL